MKDYLIGDAKKLTFAEVKEIIKKYHDENNITYCNRNGMPKLKFRIVFDPYASDWTQYETKWNDEVTELVEDKSNPKLYALENITYEIDDAGKYWFNDIIGKSLFATCLAEDDPDHFGIKLSDYLGEWKILYCYQVTQKQEETK